MWTVWVFNAKGLTVRDSPYTVSYVFKSGNTFASASTSSSLTITPATLTITATHETKVYGTTDRGLAYSASGFKFSDTAATVLSGQLARAEAGTLAGEQAGSYAIAQGTLAADSNYTIQFIGSTLTITPASLAVTANSLKEVYGSSDPSLTDRVTGVVDAIVDGVTIDDTVATVLTGSLARAQAGTQAGQKVGNYAITQGTLAANSDYTIHFTGSTLTITRATPTLNVHAPGGTYTGKPIAATVSVTGVNNTPAASLEGVTPTLTYYDGKGTSGKNLGAAPSAAGTYTVVASFAGSADYAPTKSAPTTFVITAATKTLRGTIALTSSPTAAAFGQAVTFTAAVSASGGPPPSGTVTFSDGVSPLGTVALNASGRAALTITSLPRGSQAITARYNDASGDPDSASNAATESVGPAATRIVLAPRAIVNGKKPSRGSR